MTVVYGGTTNGSWSSVLDYTDQSDNATYKLACKVYTRVTNSSYIVQLGDGVDAFGTLKETIAATSQTSSTKTVSGANATLGRSEDAVSKTFSWAKTHSTQSITLTGTAVLTNGELWSGSSSSRISGTSTATKTLTIPAKTSYTVSYNANGGSGAPGNQTKWYGETLTLSTTKPTRSGWTFMGWGSSASATSVAYASGASYTANSAITLYAIWRKTITVTYNANGGTGVPAAQSVNIYNSASSGNITLSTTKPTRSGFLFLGWNTSSSATSANRTGGTSYAFSANTTLYAVWDATPTISTLTAVRCNADGTQNDEGQCAYITCTWYINGALGDTASVTGTVTPQVGGSTTSFTFTTPDTSGSGMSTAIIGTVNGTVNGIAVVDTDMQYTISVVVANASSGSTQRASRNVILTRSFFVMDWKSGGTGVGIGRAAPSSGLEIGFNTTFDNPVTCIGSSFSTHSAISLYADNMERDVSPGSSTKEEDIYFRDKNGNTFGWYGVMQSANSANHWLRTVVQRNVSGTNKHHIFSVGIDADGNALASISGTNAQAAWRSALGAVSKTGDTMSGNLTLYNSGSNTSVISKSHNIDVDTTPSSNLYIQPVKVQDKDGYEIGHAEWFMLTSGEVGHNFASVRRGDTWYQCNMRVNSSGTASYTIRDPANFRSAIGALGKVPPSAELPVCTATSNVFPIVLGNSFANNGAISYMNTGNFRNVIAAAAKTWTSIASTSGTTAKTFSSISSYSEVLIIASYSTSYVASGVFNIASISSTEKEFYLTGGRTYGGGRRACCKLSLTKITPYQVAIDDSGANANWSVHVR